MRIPTFLKSNLPVQQQKLFRTDSSMLMKRKISKEEEYRRRIRDDGNEIIDKPTYNRLTRSFINSNGIIVRGDIAERHLNNVNADASYMAGGNIAFIRDNAKVSDVAEEMFHAYQDRGNHFGKLSDGRHVHIKREIEAQRYLLNMKDKLRIPESETKQTVENLNMYLRELKELTGEEM